MGFTDAKGPKGITKGGRHRNLFKILFKPFLRRKKIYIFVKIVYLGKGTLKFTDILTNLTYD